MRTLSLNYSRRRTILSLDVSFDHLGIEVQRESRLKQPRGLFDAQAESFRAQRAIAERKRGGISRVLGQLVGRELLRENVVLENGSQDLLEEFLLPLLVRVGSCEQLVVDKAFERGEELDLVRGLDDVIGEEGLDAKLVEGGVGRGLANGGFRWPEVMIGCSKECDAAEPWSGTRDDLEPR